MITIKLWGSRGSLSVSGAESIVYGGNTSCVEITDNLGTSLILDAGTGLRELGQTIDNNQTEANLLLTHLHMDHIQGIGFFQPFFNPNVEVNVWGPASTTRSLRERLSRYLSPPLFPVGLRDLPCKLNFHEVPSTAINIGPFKVSSDLVGHVGPTVGYRIVHPDGVITYLPDHEPALGVENFPLDKDWTSGLNLAANADLLIHDAQYSDDEYSHCVGWGHSSIRHAIKFAALAKVKELVTFHHDPKHTDTTLDQLLATVIESANPEFKVTPGTEGAVLFIG